MGTPAYMAPEQVLEQTVDARADLFAAGSLLFEMLCGHPPFTGDSVVRVLHAITAEQPPALGGSSAIVAVDRVIHRALSKNREDRYQTADAMAQDLRAALLVADSGITPTARPMTRLIVLPFRILRSDPETDFLAFSLPDAITGSLSGLESLIVRSSIVASRFTGEAQDLRTIADEADVDIVLTGTLLRAGDELRVTTQLVEAPAGTLVWSQTSQLPLGDLFKLQDDLAVSHRRVALAAADDAGAADVEARRAGERQGVRVLFASEPVGDQSADMVVRPRSVRGVPAGRSAIRACLGAAWSDPPCSRQILDTNPEENLNRAESAFTRALEINPDLSLAHNLYAHLEVDLGRAQDAMTRLLERAQSRTADPELFAGLVHACRYCGLLDASIAADEQALRLDQKIRRAWHTRFSCSVTMRRSSRVGVEGTPPVQPHPRAGNARAGKGSACGPQAACRACSAAGARLSRGRASRFMKVTRMRARTRCSAWPRATSWIQRDCSMPRGSYRTSATPTTPSTRSNGRRRAASTATRRSCAIPGSIPFARSRSSRRRCARSRRGTGRPVPLSWPLAATRCLDCLRLFRLPAFAPPLDRVVCAPVHGRSPTFEKQLPPETVGAEHRPRTRSTTPSIA